MTKSLMSVAVMAYVCAKIIPRVVESALSAIIALVLTEALWITFLGMCPVLTVGSSLAAVDADSAS
jgi:hypothetical protein